MILVISALANPVDLPRYIDIFFGSSVVTVDYLGGWNEVVQGEVAIIHTDSKDFELFLRKELAGFGESSYLIQCLTEIAV